MRCPKCGYENPSDANFCIACGEKLERHNNNIKVCPNCGAKNYTDSVFCSVCGKMLESKEETVNIEEPKSEIVKKEKANTLNKVALILSIVGAALTLVVIREEIALVGITVSTSAIVIIAIGLLAKKIQGSIKFTIALSIYGIIGHIIWLTFLLWMLPSF